MRYFILTSLISKSLRCYQNSGSQTSCVPYFFLFYPPPEIQFSHSKIFPSQTFSTKHLGHLKILNQTKSFVFLFHQTFDPKTLIENFIWLKFQVVQNSLDRAHDSRKVDTSVKTNTSPNKKASINTRPTIFPHFFFAPI